MSGGGPLVYDFAVLGPVEVRAGGRLLPAGSGRQRLVLAALLLNAGRPTSASRLIDALWVEPPQTARAQLHNMISAWRRRFGAEGARLIVTRPSGYQLQLGRHRLDLLEFRQRVRSGQQAVTAADHESAAVRLTAALSLWRGPALADVADAADAADGLIAGPRQALHEERLAAAEALMEVQLVLARHDDVLRAVPALLAAHPYRERLYELQMLALAAVGRRADALAVYRRLHRRLVDELGVEPDPALAALHQRILDGKPPSRPPTAPVLPRQLPPVAGQVTGRDKLIGAIRAELDRGEHRAPPAVVLVGPGGVGKSTVALCLGHELARTYADGQLHADLGGSRGRPVDPHDVLGRFLRALGVDGSAVPDDRDERVASYRSRLAGRRVLVVLDDAAGEEQVRPLLPGAASCAALITSRGQLAALVDAVRWTVPVLAPLDSQELLTRLVGIERTATEPDAATAIVDAVGHLPLAVTIAAARLAARPDWTLGEFAARLAGERGRLDELVVGDLDVRASIGLSYRALRPELRLAFRRLGLIAALDWPAWVLQPLSGHPVRLLDQLVDVHLVEPRGRDVAGQPRFRLHDLVADFARERSEAEDEPAERAAAVTRLLSAWLALATEADERMRHGLVAAAGLGGSRPPEGDAARLAADHPQDWFDAERAALVAAVDQACQLDDAGLAAGLALRLAGFCSLRGHQDDRERTLHDAAACARGRVDDRLLARLLYSLFTARAQRARNPELPALAAELLVLARRLGDRRLEIRALSNAGVAARRAGRLATAADRYDEAIAACAGEAEDGLLAQAQQGRAQVYGLAGDHDRAVSLSSRTLPAHRAYAGTSPRAALALTIHGDLLLGAGRLDDAERAYTEAIAITRRFGYDVGTAVLECCLGKVDLRRGRWPAAAVRLTRSLRFQEAHGDPDDIAEVLDALGDLAVHQGVPAAATAPLRRSLDLWQRVGAPLETARTLARLTRVSAATGDDQAAAEYHHRYRAILTDLGLD